MKYVFCEEKDAKVFYDDVIDVLSKKDTYNNFMIGMLDTSQELNDTDNWLFGKIINESNQVELIIICNQYNKMMMFSPTDNKTYYLYDYLSNIIHNEYSNKIREICTEPKIAKVFSELYERKSNLKSSITMNIKGLILNNLNDIETRGLSIRKATNIDYDLLCENEYYGHIDVYGVIPTKEEIDRNVAIFLNAGTYLLEDNGQVVSQAVHRRKISIGGVYTPKEYRGKGYSTICTYLLAKQILDNGAKKLVIHTDEKSSDSNYVYEKIGFVYTFNLTNIVFE